MVRALGKPGIVVYTKVPAAPLSLAHTRLFSPSSHHLLLLMFSSNTKVVAFVPLDCPEQAEQ